MKRHNTALLLVDLQNDFFPNGSLGIPQADKILPTICHLLKLPFDHIIASQDWHPPHHASFATSHGKKPGEQILLNGLSQILWPIHCVQGTSGANFHPGWDNSKVEKIFHKGIDKQIDSYSAFFDNQHLRETGLNQYLKKQHVDHLYIAGLATDYCVKYSALDAISLGFSTFVIIDGCRGVNLHPNDSLQAIQEMKQAGVQIIESADILL